MDRFSKQRREHIFCIDDDRAVARTYHVRWQAIIWRTVGVASRRRGPVADRHIVGPVDIIRQRRDLVRRR